MAEALRRAAATRRPAASAGSTRCRASSRHDDFSRGHCGWSQLVGNYEDNLDTMLPGYAQHTSAMLSTLGHWDAGSHGGIDSSYALKVATRPRAGAQNVAIKRHTFRKRGPIRFEIYFTFKPEATELQLSETDVRSVGFLFDLQGGDQRRRRERVMPHLRFLNALDGQHVQNWQFKAETTPFKAIGTSEQDLQPLSPRARGLARPARRRPAALLQRDPDQGELDLSPLRLRPRLDAGDWPSAATTASFDLSAFDSIRIPAMKNLWCMLNFCLFAETDVDKRAFLYVDSVCISGDF